MMQFDHSTTLPKESIFTGLDKRSKPQLWIGGELRDYSNQVECPKCQGHGCWNYSDNTKMSCGMCSGYGWIHESRLANLCDHKWKHVSTIGNCLNKYQCTACGYVNTVDSSG